MLKLGNADDSLSLQAEQETSVLRIAFADKKGEKETQFNMNLMTLDSEHLQIPESQFGSKITLHASEFSKICRELYCLSETLAVRTQRDRVTLTVEGDVGSGQMTLLQGETDKEDHCILEVHQEIDQQFALRYLNMFNKAAGLSSYTRLGLHLDQPLVTEFNMGQTGSLKFYLAPKISEEWAARKIW